MTTKERIYQALRDAQVHQSEPTIVLVKTRFIGEAVAIWLSSRNRIVAEDQLSQNERIKKLESLGIISRDFSNDLHRLRILGNPAAHDDFGTFAEAVEALKIAQKLADSCFYPGNAPTVNGSRQSLIGLKRPESIRARAGKPSISKLSRPR